MGPDRCYRISASPATPLPDVFTFQAAAHPPPCPGGRATCECRRAGAHAGRSMGSVADPAWRTASHEAYAHAVGLTRHTELGDVLEGMPCRPRSACVVWPAVPRSRSAPPLRAVRGVMAAFVCRSAIPDGGQSSVSEDGPYQSAGNRSFNGTSSAAAIWARESSEGSACPDSMRLIVLIDRTSPARSAWVRPARSRS